MATLTAHHAVAVAVVDVQTAGQAAAGKPHHRRRVCNCDYIASISASAASRRILAVSAVGRRHQVRAPAELVPVRSSQNEAESLGPARRAMEIGAASSFSSSTAGARNQQWREMSSTGVKRRKSQRSFVGAPRAIMLRERPVPTEADTAARRTKNVNGTAPNSSMGVAEMSSQMKELFQQIDEDGNLTALMQGLRGTNTYDEFAPDVDLQLVEVDGGQAGDEDALPLVYDPDLIAAYWSKRPGAVAKRVAQLMSIGGRFLFQLLMDIATNKLKENEVQRVIELRNIVTELGPAYIKLGQALSIRPDLLSPPAMMELQKLCDKVTGSTPGNCTDTVHSIPQIYQDLVGLVDEWALRFFEELDYVKEGLSGIRFAESMKLDLPQVVVPSTYMDYTSRRVLTTGWLEGEKLSQSSADDVGELVNIGVICYLKQTVKREERESEGVLFESVRRGKRSVRPNVRRERNPLENTTDIPSSSMAVITSDQWQAMLDAADESQKLFFQKLYDDAVQREREVEAATRATSIAAQEALLQVPEANADRFQERLAAAVAALVRLRNLEDLESRVTALEQRNQELQVKVNSLEQSQLSAPRPPNSRSAVIPVSQSSTALVLRASGTVASAGTGASSLSGSTDSSALVTVPNAGTSAQNAAVLTGVQYNGPMVDKRAATLPSKYDGKVDITSWISSMRSYFEVMRTPQEDRSMIMGTNTKPAVRNHIELQAVAAGYERIDLTVWLKVTPVRALEDLLHDRYQDKRAALKARLKLEALKGQTWRSSMQALEQHLTGLFTTPDLGMTDVSCMDVVMGVAPKDYLSLLALKDHATWRELMKDLVDLEAKDLARRKKAPAAGGKPQRKRFGSSNQLALHDHREAEDQSYADDLSLDDDLEPDSDTGCVHITFDKDRTVTHELNFYVFDKCPFDAVIGLGWLRAHCLRTTWADNQFVVLDAEGNERTVLLDETRESPVTLLSENKFCRSVRRRKEAEFVHVALVKPFHVPSTFAAFSSSEGNSTSSTSVPPTSAVNNQSNSDPNASKLVVIAVNSQSDFLSPDEDDPPPEIPANIRLLLDQFPEVLAEPRGVPERPVKHKIEIIEGSVPPKGCVYRMGQGELEELRRQIDDMIDRGWIRPSEFEFGAPVLFVPKKGGKLRMCIDYRGLNRITRKNAYPLPRIDDLLDAAGGCKVFSKIDLKSSYHQIEVDPSDQHKTAFKTRDGLYEFIVMPFGLTNAPTTFQSLMDKVLRHQLNRFVVVYLDDILIFSKSMEEHVKQLEVLQVLKDAQLHLNLEKYEFGRDNVIYLGHRLSVSGLEPEATALRLVYSDHQTLQWIKTQTDLSPTLTRWLHDIDVFDFELKHKKGCYNRVADALSRHPEYLTCLVDSYDLCRKLKEDLIEHTAKDPDLSPILEQLKADPNSQPDFHECDGLVFRRYGKFDRLCVPNHAPLQTHFLDLAHGRSGHFGFEKTYGSLLQQFDWPGMKGSAQKFIAECQVCQKVSTTGNSQVMAIVDRFSKFLNLIPLPPHAPTELVIEEFHQQYILQYGPPKTLVSDRDTRFISKDWKDFTAQIYDIKLNMTSGRHPEANGLAEEINQTVTQLLRALIVPDQNTWDKDLHKVKGLYNNSIHSATGVTPNQLQYGWSMRNPLSYLFPERSPGLMPRMPGYNAKYARLLKAVTAAMNKGQHAMIKHANKMRREEKFKVGDYVWVKMSEFSDEEGVSRKLLPLYYGPWQILKVIGDDFGPSYVVDVPPHLRTYPVFHASKLFPHIDDETFPFRDPMIPRPIDGGHEIDRIVSHEGRARNRQYKVHFLYHPLNEFFWIDRKELLKSAPRVLLDTGFFHADPHPGNLIRTPDGRLAVLDFGLMTQITDDQKYGIIEAMAHLIHRDYVAILDDFVMLGFLSPDVDYTPLLPVIEKVFEQALGGGGAKSINFQDLAADLAQVTFDYPFRIPPYFAYIIRAIGVLEGIALVGDPNFAVVDEAYPYVAQLVKSIDAVSRDRLAKLVSVFGMEAVIFPFRLPGAVRPLTLSPSLTEEDRKVVDNVKKILEFFAAGTPLEDRLARAQGMQALMQVARDLLPFLPNVATQIVPEVMNRLFGRIMARFIRDNFLETAR
ncbi:hypothetical protein CBR_g19084 [Chara braunii]|uniref:Reverse transcriptase n=1 Tax=Chara braunii TaxID=69332 RepID=A0A388KXA7_CHABU|nr:hypothetical protein CBR_g19084 [Chara braunii]|eukprot:GBG74677.1 hypothetical protein CBR_g19084 [Chara braunii]